MISFSASSADVVSYRYKVDSGLWSAEIPVATTVNYSGLTVGTHNLAMIGKDNAGNWQSTSSPSTFTWTVEQTPAITTATPSGGNYITPQAVTLTTNETGTIRFTINGAIPTMASATYNGPIAINATTTLKYFSVDAAGNAEAVKTQIYNLPPTTTVIGVPASTKLTTATLTVGGAGVVAYKYIRDGGVQSAEIPVATKIVLTGLSVASHTVSVIGKNSVGDWQSTATTVNWTVEQTAPFTTASPPGGTYATPQTVTLSASETATIYYTTNGTAPTKASAKYAAQLSIATTTTLKYFAVDQAGNAEVVETQIYTLPPTATISGVPDTVSAGVPIVVSTGGAYVIAYKYRLNSSPWSIESPVTTPRTLAGLPVGTHMVEVIGKNAAGTWQQDIDATAKVVTVN